MTTERGRMVRIAVAALVLFAGLFGGAVSVAQAQTIFPAYTSGIQVANLSDDASSVLLVAYNPDGTTNGSPLSDSIPGNSSKTYFPISNVDVGFSGSIVISAGKKIAAIANTVTPDMKYNSAYVGRSSGGTSVQIPLLMKGNGGYTSWYSLQNATAEASGPAAHVQITYSDGSNASATIPAGASKTFYQSQETHSKNVFAATITSDQPLVGAVIQESSQNILAYTAFAGGGSTEPQFPLVNANNSGIRTGIQIQNAGNTPTTVTVSYSKSATGAGQNCTETQTIQPGASNTYAFVSFTSGGTADITTNCAPGAKFVGSGKVTANSASMPLVAVVNQLGPSTYSSAYVAFAPADGGETVVMPLIMDRNGGFFTGFSVQNVGTASANVTCSFQNSSRTVQATLAPNEALVDLQNNQLGVKYVGQASCTAPGGNLIAVVNEMGTGDGDKLASYEGIKR